MSFPRKPALDLIGGGNPVISDSLLEPCFRRGDREGAATIHPIRGSKGNCLAKPPLMLAQARNAPELWDFPVPLAHWGPDFAHISRVQPLSRTVGKYCHGQRFCLTLGLHSGYMTVESLDRMLGELRRNKR